MHIPRRLVLLAVIVGVLVAAAYPRAAHLAGLVGAPDWGSDWRWLADGLDRLAAGLPLNRREYVEGPFSQLPNGPSYTWSMHPPWNATLVSPGLLLPLDLRQGAWTWLMVLTLGVALFLAWPRRLWWGTHLLLAAAFLALPAAGLIDQLHYANPNAAVVLGAVLVWHGRRRAAAGLIALGLILAAVKILPAVALATWLLATREGAASGGPGAAAGRRGVALAAAGVAALTIPILILDPGVLGDTIRVQLNLVPWDGPGNLAPQVLLAPLLGADIAALISRVVGVGLIGLVLVRRLDGPGGFVIAAGAPLLFTPQLWAHWFLIPAAAALLAAGAWPRFRTFDAWLRAAWGTEAAPDGRPGLGGSRPVRAAFAVLGTISLGVALLGIVLPVLPTTPFLLLAAACYARASSRLHAWLLRQPSLGPMIERWQRNRSMAPAVKRRAMVMVVLTFAVSIVVVGQPAPAVVLAATCATLLVFLSRIPTEP